MFSLCVFFLFFFLSNCRDWSEHNKPISATSRGTAKLYRSPGSPAKFGAFQFFPPSFHLQGRKDVSSLAEECPFCWLQETDALQESWKEPRLTLFSRPWLLFSPLFRRYRNVPFRSCCLTFLSQKLRSIPSAGKYAILSKAKFLVVEGGEYYLN